MGYASHMVQQPALILWKYVLGRPGLITLSKLTLLECCGSSQGLQNMLQFWSCHLISISKWACWVAAVNSTWPITQKVLGPKCSNLHGKQPWGSTYAGLKYVMSDTWYGNYFGYFQNTFGAVPSSFLCQSWPCWARLWANWPREELNGPKETARDLGDLRKLCSCRELNENWKTKTGWPKQITHRQHLPKLCVQQFHQSK